MRLTSSEWRRIGILAGLTLLVVAVLVFRGGGSTGPEASPQATAAPTPGGPTASEQVSDAEAAGAAAPESTTDGTETDGPTIVQAGLKSFTGALTGPVVYGTPSIENEMQFSVAVEDGIGVEATELAAIVDQVLGDERSWAAAGDYGLVRIQTGGLFQLVVTSPETTDEICAPLQTIGQLSCAIDGVVAINLERWLTGSRSWSGSLDDYRAWVINHEVGHQLGETHRSCAGPGEIAPVMQQQSIDLDGCEPNPWPFPDGAPPTTATPVEPTVEPTTEPDG